MVTTKNRKALLLLLTLGFLLGVALAMVFPNRNGTSGEIPPDPDAEREAFIQQMLTDMTPEEKIGQMFMGCFYNGTPSLKTIETYHLGSALLFGASFQKDEKNILQEKLQKINSESKIPPIIAVDEEGGTVVRVSGHKSYRAKGYRSPRQLYAEGGLSKIIEDAHEKNALLKDIGIHLNLAPVCDIATNRDDFMYSRSLGQNATITSEFVAELVTACREDGIGCCLKHFPGYGNASDTHTGAAVDKRSRKHLEENDLLPFAAGIKAGAPAVLFSHNTVTSIDAKRPASLSAAMHRLLREDLGFDGVILTDDLSMDSVADLPLDTDTAVAAILAGSDLLCTGDYKEQYTAVCEAYEQGIISLERLDESVRRILRWKIELGLVTPGSAGEDPGTSEGAAEGTPQVTSKEPAHQGAAGNSDSTAIAGLDEKTAEAYMESFFKPSALQPATNTTDFNQNFNTIRSNQQKEELK